jgi:hypothetical protein
MNATVKIQLIANGATEEEMLMAIKRFHKSKSDIKRQVKKEFNQSPEKDIEDIYCITIDLLML